MSLTIRRVDHIRDALDTFKKQHYDIKTDSGAIEYMINKYQPLTEQLAAAEKLIDELQIDISNLRDQQVDLSNALAPFVRHLI